jgi:predicted enzyme related to lactoylglutathione lyase
VGGLSGAGRRGHCHRGARIRTIASHVKHGKEFVVNQGFKTIIYPVTDIAGAKTLYSKLLGVEPYANQSYYVGFRVGDQEIGLDPNGHNAGMTGPINYWHVDDIRQTLQSLLDAGAVAQQEVRDVGGGRLIATVKDGDGNVVGLLQSS